MPIKKGILFAAGLALMLVAFCAKPDSTAGGSRGDGSMSSQTVDKSMTEIAWIKEDYKEALAKALGAPGGLQWHDCEVTKDDEGRPSFSLTGTVVARAEGLGARTLHLSLSHDAGLASAMVVAESEGAPDAGSPHG